LVARRDAWAAQFVAGAADLFGKVLREFDTDTPVYPVGVTKIHTDPNSFGTFRNAWPDTADDFFEKFQGRLDSVGRIERRSDQEPGTVFFLNGNLIATCAHVMSPFVSGHKLSKSLKIVLGHRYRSRITSDRTLVLPEGLPVALHPMHATDMRRDLALMKFDAGIGLQPFELANRPVASSNLEDAQGAPVYVLGYPADEAKTILSTKVLGLAKGAAFRMEDKKHAMVFHSANTQPGNSGSPLIDTAGKIIGIHRGWFDGDERAANFTLPTTGKSNQAVSAMLLTDWIEELRNDPAVTWLTNDAAAA